MHKLSSRKLALAVAASLAVCGIGHVASQADSSKVYVDSDVSVSSAIERYIASNGDVSAIEDTNEAGTKSESVSTDTDATATDAAEQTTETSTAKYPEYEGKAVVCTPDNVNIRAAADAESEVIGLISSGGVMIVMDKGEEWSLIASGDVIGYINNDYIAFGDEGAEYAYNNVYKVAVVTTTTLRVRLEPDTESECVTLIPYGEKYALLDQQDGWVYIEIDDTLSGYVSDEYIDIVPASIYARPITEFAEPSSDDYSDDSSYDNDYDSSDDYNDYDDDSDDYSYDYSEDDYSDDSSDDYDYDSSDDYNDYDDSSDDNDYYDSSDDYSDDSSYDYEENETTTEAVEVGESSSSSALGEEIASFACQFVGNPYVYGGSSLTNGADCSGFTMAVYAQYGISLPHGATMQSNCTTEVSISDLQPGDLVYYDHGTGSIEHVGLYIGNNQIVHASTETTGIIISSVNYSTPFKATRPLQ